MPRSLSIVLLRSVINSPEILNFTCLLYSKCRFWAKKKSAACVFIFGRKLKSDSEIFKIVFSFYKAVLRDKVIGWNLVLYIY